MSRAKFASITASLLARKGEARPWTGIESRNLELHGDWHSEAHDLRQVELPAQPEHALHHVAEAHTHNGAHNGTHNGVHNGVHTPLPHVLRGAHDHDGDKRYAIRMSPKEFERLGIIAVKRGVTRQHLMREMLEQFLASASSQYCADCTCLGEGNCANLP